METRTQCEREHEFDLVLSGVDDLSDDVQDALFESGCDDATLSLRAGVAHMTFARRAPTVKDAIISAVHDIKKADIGAVVLRVDECNLVTQAEMARRIGKTRQLIHQYIKGNRGPGGFPPPVFGQREGCPLWAWCEVAVWLRQNNMIKEEQLTDARQIHAINIILEYHAQLQLEPEFVDQVVAGLCP